MEAASLSKLADNKQFDFKKRLAEIAQRVEKEIEPTKDLSLAIIQASVNCRDAIKGQISAPTEAKRLELEAYVFYEFLYFYLHLTMRSAFVQLTGAELQNLQNYLGPLISSVAVDSYFAHWPNDLKKRMRRDFYNKLNDAELEYTEATQYESSKQGIERGTDKLRALFATLGANVAELSGHKDDIPMIVAISGVASREWVSNNFENFVAEVKKNPPPSGVNFAALWE